MSRVLLFAPDIPPAPGVMAAGPGIRYAELATALRDEGHEVTLAAPGAGADAVWTDDNAAELARDHDAAIVGQGNAELGRRLAREAPDDLPLVVDCYAPGLIECITLADGPSAFPGFHARAVELLRRGDLFLVANERQRLYTLGLLSALGRLNPITYDDPPLLEVPFGVPNDPPAPWTGRSVARGTLVPDGCPLLVWYGGVYPWFDAATAVAGFARALEHVPDAYMAIVGGRHPRAHAPDGELVRALAVATEARIADRVVEAPWGPYEDRIGWYVEADCAICLHHAGVETELSQRTRLIDLVWGGVPIICSSGDVVGERAAAAGAAVSIPIGDVDAAADAIASFLGDAARREAARAAARSLAGEMSWRRVAAPLAAWLAEPRVAGDRFRAGSWRDAASTLVRTALATRRR